MGWGGSGGDKKPKKAKPTAGLARTGGRASPVDYAEEDRDIWPDLHVPDPILRSGKQLSPDSIEQMRKLVEMGAPVPTAVAAVGGGMMGSHWAARARTARAAGKVGGFGEGEVPELKWLDAMEEGKAVFECNMVSTIAAAAPSDWKASAFLLERRASRRWHLQSKLQIEAKDGSKLDITTMSTEKLLAIAKGILPENAVRQTPALLGSGDVSDAEIVDEDLEKA